MDLYKVFDTINHESLSSWPTLLKGVPQGYVFIYLNDLFYFCLVIYVILLMIQHLMFVIRT